MLPERHALGLEKFRDAHAFGYGPRLWVPRRDCAPQQDGDRGQQLIKVREAGSPQRRAGAEDVEIGRKIRTLRLERGLSQSRLASGSGLSFQQLQKYESGANRVSAGRLQRIAELFGVPVTVFYEPPGGRPKRDDTRAEAFAYLQARSAVRLARGYAGISSRATRNAILVLIEALRDK